MSREDAPRFRSVNKDDCLDCDHSEDMAESKRYCVWCHLFNFEIPYPCDEHVCDSFQDD